MKSQVFCTLLLPLALCLASLTANAGTIFNDFGPGDSYQSDFGWAVSGTSSNLGQFIQANEFTAGRSGTVGEIDLGISLVAGAGNGTASLWTVGPNGLPAAQLGSSWNFTAHQTFGMCCAVERISTPGGPELSVGTNYFVILQADDTTFDEWNLNSTGSIGLDLISRDNRNTWISNGLSTLGAFAILSSAVPEPGTFSMLVAGILGSIGAFRFRR